MALTMGLHQNALHNATKDAMFAAKISNNQQGIPMPIRYEALTFREARTKEDEPVIPAPQNFTSLIHPSHSRGDSSSVPNVGECAAHLELLEAFYALKAKVLQSAKLDPVLGFVPRPRTVYRTTYVGRRGRREVKPVKLKDTTFGARRKDKWPLFLRLAVARFKIWLEEADLALKDLPLHSDRDAAGRAFSSVLPPLDVLMVWHSCLLNPLDYQEYCKAHGLNRICRIDFPWASIHKSLNSSDWSFTLPVDIDPAGAPPTNHANLEIDILEYLENVPKRSTAIAEMLVAYGQGVISHSGVVMRPFGSEFGLELASRDAAFARCLEASVYDAAVNQPIFEAVQRQEAFVKKMHAHLWIRSPALVGTHERAIGRYLKFIRLFKIYPNTTLVPTLDIDLVWHTHQCSPAQYRDWTIQRAGRFIDHDDKIGRTVLDDGLVTTEKLFRIRFGQEYLICHCWDCEAALSAVSASKEEDRARTDMKYSGILEDVAYHRAVEIARRAGKPLPART